MSLCAKISANLAIPIFKTQHKAVTSPPAPPKKNIYNAKVWDSGEAEVLITAYLANSEAHQYLSPLSEPLFPVLFRTNTFSYCRVWSWPL